MCTETIWKETLKCQQRRLWGDRVMGILTFFWLVCISYFYTMCLVCTKRNNKVKSWGRGRRSASRQKHHPHDRQGRGEGRAHRRIPGVRPVDSGLHMSELFLVVSHSFFSGFVSKYHYFHCVGRKPPWHCYSSLLDKDKNMEQQAWEILWNLYTSFPLIFHCLEFGQIRL